MGYKSILTILTDIDDVAPVLEATLPFARSQGAHLDVLCLGIDRTQTGYYFAGATAIIHEETQSQSRDHAKALEDAVRDRLGRTEITWAVEALVAQSAMVSGLVAHRAQFSDLVMLPKPYGEGRASDAPVIVEAAMFQGSAPVMVLPGNDRLPSDKPTRAVVAWNESAEALVAARRALPLLIAADCVEILIIDPPRHDTGAADPGAELSKMLSRHGARVEVSVIACTMPRISDMIERHVRDKDADLLVMGAYGHSRLREAILGGATRNLLEQASVPVLMAR
ncbi:MAG: universal stress protein [Alterinioella nitratireducens]|jgi:nucleotide-binding universal stress UspA family protein|uniref:universal stress protein n=1 Tax=Alterinioella nitratireducens TaxID=2735915 RepID=UPI000C691B2F|nr:universal stress protein [Alterinioella nitratireducens]MAX74917.1 universal stress protein [Nioella sp.]NPD19865.1 universal stress protein [Alterinioella nitratireducens]